MGAELIPKKDDAWLSNKEIKDKHTIPVSGVGKTTSLHEYFFAKLIRKSPARATYCISVFKRCGRVQLPRGCNF
jgi:hypothetical protein